MKKREIKAKASRSWAHRSFTFYATNLTYYYDILKTSDGN